VSQACGGYRVAVKNKQKKSRTRKEERPFFLLLARG